MTPTSIRHFLLTHLAPPRLATPLMRAAPATTLADRFALVATGLRDLLAARMAKSDTLRPLLMLLWSRLHRVERRIATLAARFAAGQPVAPRPRSPARNTPSARPAKRALRLPRRAAWLIAHTSEAAAYAEHFRQLLQEPEMAALLQAAPQLKGQLRPVLRVLMLDLPEPLALPRRPRKPKPPRPRKPRPEPIPDFWRPGPIRPFWNITVPLPPRLARLVEASYPPEPAET